MNSTTTQRKPVLELINAEVARNDQGRDTGDRIQGVNWTFSEGDFWVIAGAPGAGKTDFMSTAAGLQRPAAGELILFGYPTRGATEKDLLEFRLRLGLVFEQGGRVFNEMTVAQNVTLPICYHGNCRPAEAQEQVMPYLEATGLKRFAQTSPAYVVRSHRPRIGLARALAMRPDALLLDNPLGGLDPRQIRWWLSFLHSLWKGHRLFDHKPLSIAVTTDDLRPWLEVGRQFALLNQNRWSELGDRSALERNDDPDVKDLLGAGINEQGQAWLI